MKACHNVGFVNIGRGNVIQEEDIISALDGGMLRAAVLDVFNTEPLPPASPLWSHPRVTGNIEHCKYSLLASSNYNCQ